MDLATPFVGLRQIEETASPFAPSTITPTPESEEAEANPAHE